MTKKEMFATIADLCADNEEIVAFCDKEIASIDKKNEAAKARAAAKRAAGDELEDAIFEVMGDDFMSIADVVAALDNEEFTKGKVTYRLNQLVEKGLAIKEDAKVEGTDGKAKTVKVFKRVSD